MKLAIHKRVGSYSDNWIKFCEKNNIHYKIVNCFDSDIIGQLKNIDGLLWHWNQDDYSSKLVALQIIFTLNKAGIPTYPNYDTAFMFDDKVGQKYLFESIDAPLVRTNVFFNKVDALNWIKKEDFPKVFKLRGGAGAEHVKLLNNKWKAKREIKKIFGKGIPQTNRRVVVKDKVISFRNDSSKDNLLALIKSASRFFIPSKKENSFPREKGYIYFQDFLKGNYFDTRLVVVGKKCMGFIRYNRKNDFRASGSGMWSFDPEKINLEDVEMVFGISEKLGFQSMAYDILSDGAQSKVIEMSCFFGSRKIDKMYLGYWDRELNWHKGSINPPSMIIEDFINSLEIKSDKF